uniref:Uncharacterized protein n=1 Tax=Acinetobacter pittii TaxID=48296 RepID=A0A6G6AR64_ACIPI|nr:hypothetical protein [Acinetobacter pittii]
MFLLSCYLTRRQIGITPLENKVNTFFQDETKLLSGGNYSALNCESKEKVLL